MPTYCIPALGSVPGSPNQFDWWTVTPPPVPTTLQYSPDNPNWLNSFSLSQGLGANRDYVFRAGRGTISATPYLFLSFLVRVSSNEPFLNRVNFLLGNSPNYVGFQAQLSNPANVVAGTQNDSVFNYRVQSCLAAGGQIGTNGVASQNELDFEVSARMWVDAVAPGRQLFTRWGFQVAIPLGANWTSKNLNLPLSGTFKFWYELYTSTGVGMGATANLFQMVGVPAGTHTSSSTQVIPPGSALQESELLEMSTAGVGCTTGVALSSANIGTRNPPGGGPARTNTHTIRLDLGQQYPPNLAIAGPDYDESKVPVVNLPQFQNEFFAVPTFPVGTNSAALRARFSLANWGSQYANPGANSWRPIPGLEDLSYNATPGDNDFRHTWPTAGENVSAVGAGAYVTPLVRNINKYLNASGNGTPMPADAQSPHQCMLVEMSSTDPAVIITTSSVYTNMNIAEASTFRRFSAISVEGLAPISSQPRDVYLYLQTYNMPVEVKNRDVGVGASPFGRDRPPTFNAAGNQGPFEVEDIAEFHPTYTVHVYHDTGEKFELEDGRKVPILRPQTAFGYFAVHKGPLVGWDSRIYGAEKLSENTYIIRVPNNGLKYVETVFQARATQSEALLPPDTGSPGAAGCLAGLLAWLKGLFS